MLPQVTLKPHTLLGTSEESLRFPLPDGDSIDVGPVTVTLDHLGTDADGGLADLTTGRFNASFTVQIVAPGLYDLVASRGLDPTSVGPLRAVARWDGRYTPEGQLEASAAVEVLPGSLWAGTTGRTVCSGVCGDCGTVQGDVPILQMMETVGSAEDGALDHLIYLACPCAFEMTFPPELGGASTTATIRGVLMFRALPAQIPVATFESTLPLVE